MSTDLFSGEDEVGLETLEIFAKAAQFNKWMFDSIAAYCKGSILEIGSGIGNISTLLLKVPGSRVTLSDIRKKYCGILTERFANNPGLAGVTELNISIPNFTEKYAQLLGRFDTVIALNVIEHINDDKLALYNCQQLLKKDGHLVILVPAFRGLYNSLDKELGHFRRYNKKSLSAVITNAGLQVVNKKYFNSAGMFGWWIFGSVLKRKIVSSGQVSSYNKLVPVFRLLDKFTSSIAGLSVIVVAKK